MTDLIYGKKVQVSRSHPRMQCSAEFVRLQSQALVAETNKWMAEFFGYQNLMKDGEVYLLMGETLLMNENTYRELRKVTVKAGPIDF